MGVRGAARTGVLPWRPAGLWLALLGLFVVVTLSVERDWWHGLDRSVNEWAARQRGTSPWHASKVVFDVATPEIALTVVLVLAVLVGWRRHRWDVAAEAAIRIGLVVASVLLLKPLLAVPGPTRDPLGDHGGSFPSGHTTSTVVCVTLILAWVGSPRSAAGRAAVAGVVAALVGLAVIYVRYHYVSDVVGGILLGLLVVAVPLPARRRQDDATTRPGS